MSNRQGEASQVVMAVCGAEMSWLATFVQIFLPIDANLNCFFFPYIAISVFFPSLFGRSRTITVILSIAFTACCHRLRVEVS